MKKELDEMVIKDYQTLTTYQNNKIELLKEKIKNYDSIQNAKCMECDREATSKYVALMSKLQPFEDDYFKGVDFKTIAELAKKSLRITTENNKLNDLLEDISEFVSDCMINEEKNASFIISKLNNMLALKRAGKDE